MDDPLNLDVPKTKKCLVMATRVGRVSPALLRYFYVAVRKKRGGGKSGYSKSTREIASEIGGI